MTRSESKFTMHIFWGSVLFSLTGNSSHSIVPHFSTQFASPLEHRSNCVSSSSFPSRHQYQSCVISHRVTSVSNGRSHFSLWPPRFCFGDEFLSQNHNQWAFFNLLKPSGFFTYHQVEHSKILHGVRFALSVL